MTDPKHIVFLTGFMGSGKSTIGPEVARKIGYDFVDIDDVVEKEEGLSISDIFQRYGEDYFRNLEKKILDELSGSSRKIVIALGGGTLTSEESRKLVRNHGILVYLETSREEILRRVRKKRNRPMLLSPNGKPLDDVRLSARLDELLAERESQYKEANIVVSTSDLTFSKSVDEIILKLKGHIV